VPAYARHNGHLFYITVETVEVRDALLQYLLSKGVHAVFHYLALHNSPYFREKHDGHALPNAERFASTLLRLPFYYSLSEKEISYITEKISEFFAD